MKEYVISFSNGDREEIFNVAAVARCEEIWPDAEIGHDGDLDGGGDRTLVWESEEDSENDDGARAVASIRRA